MRISEVSIDLLEVPLRTTLSTASAGWAVVRMGLLSLRTDTGLTGLGEVAVDGIDVMTTTLATETAPPLVKTLLGLDLEDVGAFDARLAAIDAWPGVGRALRSAAATARADALARAAGRSVAAWLVEGAVPGSPLRFLESPPASSVAVNALVGIADAEVAAAEARRLVETGYTCLKLKGGGEAAAALVRRVAAVRGSVGPLTSLRLDLNGALDEEAAVDVLVALQLYRLEYVEQPLPASAGVGALARLRRRVATPIAADEAVTDPTAVRALLRAGAVDVLVVKPARVGGLVEAARIVELALASDTGVTVATLVESGVGVAAALHLAAALPGDRAHGLSTAGLLASDLLAGGPTVQGGRMAVPLGPGLGVAIDPLAVERSRLAVGVRGA